MLSLCFCPFACGKRAFLRFFSVLIDMWSTNFACLNSMHRGDKNGPQRLAVFFCGMAMDVA